MGYQKSKPASKTSSTPAKANTKKSAGIQNELGEPVDMGNGLYLTGVRTFPIQSTNSRLCGFCDITLNDSFVVKGLKILNGQNGLFLGMPAREKDGEYYDQAYPITAEARESLMSAILPLFE